MSILIDASMGIMFHWFYESHNFPLNALVAFRFLFSVNITFTVNPCKASFWYKSPMKNYKLLFNSYGVFHAIKKQIWTKRINL